MNNVEKIVRISLVCALGMAFSAFAAAPVVKIGADKTLLIDNFENGDFISELGEWETFNENGYVTSFDMSIAKYDDAHSKVLRIDYEFPDALKQQNGNWEWVETRVFVAPGGAARDMSSCNDAASIGDFYWRHFLQPCSPVIFIWFCSLRSVPLF